MNYFEFYNIPVSFVVNEAALKKQFYQLSKKYHPDFFTLESQVRQAEVLELSTLNNEAYKTLSDFDKRMKYVLELKGILAAEGENKIPQDFLMEMMDINEQLMELEFDFDAKAHESIEHNLQQLKAQLYADVAPIIENYDDSRATKVQLMAISGYYLKKRYLLRIQENLDKFATRWEKVFSLINNHLPKLPKAARLAELVDLPLPDRLPEDRQAGALKKTVTFWKMYFVYALKSQTRNYIYVGITDSLDRRISQHNSGKSKTTKPYRPFLLICSESFETRQEARKKEIYFKSGSGKEYLKKL